MYITYSIWIYDTNLFIRYFHEHEMFKILSTYIQNQISIDLEINNSYYKGETYLLIPYGTYIITA